jgi:hypothetical protein
MPAEPADKRYTTGRPADIDGVVETFLSYRWPACDRLWRRSTRKTFFNNFAHGITHLIRTRCSYEAEAVPKKQRVQHALYVGGAGFMSADILIDVEILLKILRSTRRFEAKVSTFDRETKLVKVLVVTKQVNVHVHARKHAH